MPSLAVKYRPTTWSEVVGQSINVSILKKQIENKCFKNAYLFCGTSGAGKTTLARLFAKAINNGVGEPIEIDGASNNGVDNIREIVNSAQERSLSGTYKVFIIDETHALTNNAWQAFLKCIEETPKYTIFIFCTTDPQKIPATILNRVMRFNFSRVSVEHIQSRLEYICQQEHFTNYTESIAYISKICDGSMRNAISMLEKVSEYSTDISINNTLAVLGDFSYNTYFNLINAIIDRDTASILSILQYLYNNGADFKVFTEQFLTFCIECLKFVIFHSMTPVQIPITMEAEVRKATTFDNSDKYYSYFIDKLLSLKNMLKTDTSPYSTTQSTLLQMARLV